MPRVQDQEPVQTFGPNRPHEPFRDPIRLRCLNRRPNNTHVLGLEHGVTAACELAIAIANQKPNRLLPLNESPRDLPRLLRDPRIVRMCRAAGQVDTAAAEFNEEQHIQSLEHTVSTVKKSTAMMLLACVRRNSRRDGWRRTVGPSPSARRI